MSDLPPGSAILLLDRRKGKPHLWFILTEPDVQGKVLAVMLVTRKPGRTDETTVLKSGEYHFGSDAVDGAIDYGESILIPLDQLLSRIHKGSAKVRTPLTGDQLARVCAGIDSPHTPNWVITYFNRDRSD